MTPTVLLSGGFDPIHQGHVRMICDAATFGSVIIALNSDAWLVRKKGFVFMPWEDRREVLMSMRDITDVHAVDDTDGTVCEALRTLRPSHFGNGGDRTTENTPELAACRALGIVPLFGLGGGKVASSSALTAHLRPA